MKNKYLWILLLIGVQLTLNGCANNNLTPPPTAINGQLDLTDWKFERDGSLELSGEWGFYWQALPSPTEITDPTHFIAVPGHWSGYRLDDELLPKYGYATYRLTIELADVQEPLALDIFTLETAYDLYINGQYLGSNGTVGKTEATTTPQWHPQLLTYDPPTKQLDIVVHIANFHHRRGGLGERIILGLESQIRQQRDHRIASALFLFGSILIMGIYHIGLFMIRQHDKAPLYFGLVCFAIAIRGIVVNDSYLIQRFPATSWTVLVKLAYLSIYIAVPFFVLYLRALYPQEFAKRFQQISVTIGIILSTIVVISPVYIFTETLIVYHIYLLTASFYSIYILIKATSRKREGAMIFLGGFFILFVVIVNDILNTYQLISTGFWDTFGLFIFIFAQAFMLSIRFSKAFQQVETLTQTLEARVLKRTQHLQALNKVMQDELALARDMQYSLLPPARPNWPTLDIISYTVPMREVGGDFYTHHALADDRFVIAVGDVSGKGVSAALLMATSLVQFDASINLNLTPAERMAYLDETIAVYAKPHRQNCAMCYVEIEVQHNQSKDMADKAAYNTALHSPPHLSVTEQPSNLHIVNAGGIPPYIKRLNGSVEFYEVGGFALGQQLGTLTGYEQQTLPIYPGDMIILISDGVIEANNPAGELLSFEALQVIIANGPNHQVEAMLNHIQQSLEAYMESAEPHDDMTIVVIQLQSLA